MQLVKRYWLLGSALLTIVLLPLFLPSYWLFLATSMAIVVITLRSLGLVTGQAGMISLCQLSFVALGAWITSWLHLYGPPMPFSLQVVLGGLAVVPFGLLIGLPALRLRSVNLAVVTLAFASAVTELLSRWNFPGVAENRIVQRDGLLQSDGAYFWFCATVCILVLFGMEWLSRRTIGSAWLAVRHSERATAALGLSVQQTKLSAFALSAGLAGLAGGLMVGQLGQLSASFFGPTGSLALFALSTMIGTRYPEGALIAGALSVFMPELMRRLGLPADLGDLIFGLGALHALSQGRGLIEQVRRQAAARQARQLPAPVSLRAPVQLQRPQIPSGGLELRDLSVNYGSIKALRHVSFSVAPQSVTALIGPNGAGKSSLIDALSGFLPSYSGSVLLAGKPIDTLRASARARAGLRRSFQQDRTIPEITVGRYLDLAAGRRLDPVERDGILAFFGCPAGEQLLATVPVGTRRLVEVAAVVAARPMVALLDEPAAGLSQAESQQLGAHIAAIPHTFGCAVLLVEHDLALVRAACTSIVVLDFGQVIAAGPPEQILADPKVIAAYLGAETEQPTIAQEVAA
jgi:branched-chain amino acid transport system permease protein